MNWFNLNLYYTNLIRVKEFEENSNEFKETRPFFQSAFKVDGITNKYAREFGTTIFVFTKAKVNINKRLEQEIKEEKNYED